MILAYKKLSISKKHIMRKSNSFLNRLLPSCWWQSNFWVTTSFDAIFVKFMHTPFSFLQTSVVKKGLTDLQFHGCRIQKYDQAAQASEKSEFGNCCWLFCGKSKKKSISLWNHTYTLKGNSKITIICECSEEMKWIFSYTM